MAKLQLNTLQQKHWDLGLARLLASKKGAKTAEEMINELWTLEGWLKSWRLKRLGPLMAELGAVDLIDIFDLTPEEVRHV